MTVLLHVWSYNLKGMELKKTGYGPVLSHSTMHLPNAQSFLIIVNGMKHMIDLPFTVDMNYCLFYVCFGSLRMNFPLHY